MSLPSSCHRLTSPASYVRQQHSWLWGWGCHNATRHCQPLSSDCRSLPETPTPPVERVIDLHTATEGAVSTKTLLSLTTPNQWLITNLSRPSLNAFKPYSDVTRRMGVESVCLDYVLAWLMALLPSFTNRGSFLQRTHFIMEGTIEPARSNMLLCNWKYLHMVSIYFSEGIKVLDAVVQRNMCS